MILSESNNIGHEEMVPKRAETKNKYKRSKNIKRRNDKKVNV